MTDTVAIDTTTLLELIDRVEWLTEEVDRLHERDACHERTVAELLRRVEALEGRD